MGTELSKNVNFNNNPSADKLKSRLEKYRISRGIQVPSASSTASVQMDQKEEELVRELESEKVKYVSPSLYRGVCRIFATA